MFPSFLLFIFFKICLSTLHRTCIPDCVEGKVLSSEHSHNVETRTAIDPSLNIIIFLRGSRSTSAAYHGGNLDIYSLTDFSDIDSYELVEYELHLTDGIIKYNSEYVFLLVNPWDMNMGVFERSVFFFSVTSSTLTYIGESQYSSDLESGFDADCFSQQVLWFGTKIYTLISGQYCHPGSSNTPSSAIWMYDTSIQGYIGSSQAYTTRVSFTYLGLRMFLWHNTNEGEDRLLVFDFDAGLHEFDLDLSLQSSNDKLTEYVMACDYIAIGNVNNSISDYEVVTETDVIYVVYSSEESSTYYFIVYDLKNRESLQSFMVVDSDSSYSPNAPFRIFVDQNKWILYVFGIYATMKFRIDPSTFLFSSTSPYRIDNLDFTKVEEEGENAGPAYFFPPSLHYSGLALEGEPEVYQTYAISHDSFCEDQQGGGESGCATTLYDLKFYTCSFGYYVDNSTMTNNQYEQINLALPSNDDELCRVTPDGYFASEIDATSLSSCELGGYPKKLSSTMECTSCDLGYYSPVPILNSSFCLPCPEGTYSAVTWASSASSCTPCPENTYGVMEAADSLSRCESCGDPEEYFCGLGATEKIRLSDVSVATAYPKLVLEESDEDGSSWMGTFLIKVFCSAGVMSGSIALFFCLFHILCCWDTTKDLCEILCLPISCLLCPVPTLRRKVIVFGDGKSSTGLRKSEMIKCNRGYSNFCEFFRSMRALDFFFSMGHDVKEGESPVKRKTGCGGVMSFVAISVFTVLLTLSIVEFSSGFKESVTTTKLYFQGEEMQEDYGEFRFYYTLYGIFDGCEDNVNQTTYSGFQVLEEYKSCVDLESYSGCTCSWICKNCSIMDSQLLVNFEFDTGGKYVTFVEYNISVPHYIPNETFDLVSGVTEEDQSSSGYTIQNLELEVALFKSMHVQISDWTILVDFLPSSTRNGLSVSQLSSRKTLNSVADAEGKFTMQIDMKLSNLQFIVEELLRMSLLGILGQTVALFSFSVAVGRLLFMFFGGSCSSVKDVCCCVGFANSVLKKCWVCRKLKNVKETKKDVNAITDDDFYYEKRRKRRRKRKQKKRKDVIYSGEEEPEKERKSGKSKDDLEFEKEYYTEFQEKPEGVITTSSSSSSDDYSSEEEDEEEGGRSILELARVLEDCERMNDSSKDQSEGIIGVDEEVEICKKQIKKLVYVCKKMIYEKESNVQKNIRE